LAQACEVYGIGRTLTYINIMSTESQTQTATIQVKESETPALREPLQLKGVLDQFKSFDVTPVIGREFVDVNLKDLLRASNSDELIRDLAITSELFHVTE